MRLGVVLVRVLSRGLADIDLTLASLDGERLDGLLLANDSTFQADSPAGARIIEFARDRHLPSASTAFSFARRGGLVALGTDQKYLRQRAAEYVHRIIDGARPADLPVERPSRFLLSVNLATAKAIGVTVPPLLLAGADEIIE
jgi:putative ABC transport system substrate-binding protein